MRAQILQQHPDVEEEMRIRISSCELTVFASVCPNPVFVGGVYDIELFGVSLDDPDLEIQTTDEERIESLGGYRYRVWGRLEGECLHVKGITLDVGDCIDSSLPAGTFVRLEVDRIGASFP